MKQKFETESDGFCRLCGKWKVGSTAAHWSADVCWSEDLCRRDRKAEEDKRLAKERLENIKKWLEQQKEDKT